MDEDQWMYDTIMSEEVDMNDQNEQECDVFDSRDDVLHWARSVAHENRFVTIIISLPCACELSKYVVDCIPLDSFHMFWRRLSFSDQRLSEPEVSIKEEMETISKRFEELDICGKFTLKSKVREIAYLDQNLMCPPPAKVNTKGALKKPMNRNPRSTMCDSSYWEYVDVFHSVQNSNSSVRRSASSSEQPNPRRIMPMLDHFQPFIHDFIDNIVDVKADGNYGYRSVAGLLGMGEDSWSLVHNHLLKELGKFSDDYIKLFGDTDKFEKLRMSLLVDGLTKRDVVTSDVPDIKRVKKSGKKVPGNVPDAPLDNISFHSIGNVERWKFVYQRRLALERELGRDALDCKEIMDLIKAAGLLKTVTKLGDCYESLRESALSLHYKLFEGTHVPDIVSTSGKAAASVTMDKWMDITDMGYVIASKYNVIFVSLSQQQSMTLFPLRSQPPADSLVHRIICISHVYDNHFVQVYLKDRCPLPPVALLWPSNCHPQTKQWQTPYISRMQHYKSFMMFKMDYLTDKQYLDEIYYWQPFTDTGNQFRFQCMQLKNDDDANTMLMCNNQFSCVGPIELLCTIGRTPDGILNLLEATMTSTHDALLYYNGRWNMPRQNEFVGYSFIGKNPKKFDIPSGCTMDELKDLIKPVAPLGIPPYCIHETQTVKRLFFRQPNHHEYSDKIIKFKIIELKTIDDVLKVLVQSNYRKKFVPIEILAIFSKHAIEMEDEVPLSQN
ncbi:hypothetical protein HKD37_19G053209 [Glycine soja]